ncbi:MAG: hypothetical protein ACYTFQ_30135 [Planctomycetota bacterium]|jgi:hypothetical protein
MPTRKEDALRHAAHYLELAAQCLKSQDLAVLRLNEANIRYATQVLLALLGERNALSLGYIDMLEGTPCPAIESGGSER